MGKLAKKQETALTKWDDELAKHAADVAGKEQLPTGSFVSIRGGQMSIAGNPVKDNRVNVVIVDHIYENAYYEGDYDADNPQPPVCYAFGREEKEMAPHEKCSEPQNETCMGCEKNVFGSAERGKGKACKNSRRLALITADDMDADSISEGAIVYMKLPVTSTRAWAGYVQGLAAKYKRPPFGVVTEIAVIPDPKTQFKVGFTLVDQVPNNLIGPLMARREKVADEIMFPYGTPAEKEKPAKKVAVAGKKRKF